MTSVFITSTGTELGKTHVMEILLMEFSARQTTAQGAPIRGLKPVVSGFDASDLKATDPGRILTALGQKITADTIAEICPWRFAAPLAPNMAARCEAVDLVFDDIIAFCRSETAPDGLTLIEGAGGLMAPLTDADLNLDLIAALKCPVILVAGTYLGTISHTLTAIRVLQNAEISIQAVVLSEFPNAPVPAQQTISTLTKFAPGVRFTSVPHQPARDAAQSVDLIAACGLSTMYADE